MRLHRWILLTVALAAGPATLAHAQRVDNRTSYDQPFDFAFTPGVTPPFNGASPYEIYNYQLGMPFLYLGVNRTYVSYNDYLDRFDRALRNGYPIPRDPYFTRPPVTPQGVPVAVNPADPATDPADILPQPAPRRRGLFRRY